MSPRGPLELGLVKDDGAEDGALGVSAEGGLFLFVVGKERKEVKTKGRGLWRGRRGREINKGESFRGKEEENEGKKEKDLKKKTPHQPREHDEANHPDAPDIRLVAIPPPEDFGGDVVCGSCFHFIGLRVLVEREFFVLRWWKKKRKQKKKTRSSCFSASLSRPPLFFLGLCTCLLPFSSLSIVLILFLESPADIQKENKGEEEEEEDRAESRGGWGAKKTKEKE